jgi:cytidylate kinase
MAVITMSRQFGSGGDAIAQQVCDLLGYRYLDKWLLQNVASEVGLSSDEVVDFSEEHYKARSFFESLFGPRQRVVTQISSRSRATTGETLTNVIKLDEAQCVDLIRVSIKAACKRDNILIVGRGSQAILAGMPGVLHVRIVAPMELRMQHLSEQEHMTMIEARTLIDQKDYAAAQYLERFFNIDWADPLHYALVINTAVCGPETAAQIIATAARQLEPVAS